LTDTHQYVTAGRMLKSSPELYDSRKAIDADLCLKAYKKIS